MRNTIYFLVFMVLGVGCKTYDPFYSSAESDWKSRQVKNDLVEHELFLVGDAGHNKHSKTTLDLLDAHLKGASQESSVVFMGNNAYPHGLVDASDEENCSIAKGQIDRQLDILKNFKGNPYFVAGNKDWANSGKLGFNNVVNQEEYIHEILEREGVFMPGDGCPGPNEVQVNDHLTILFIDTQWWLHEWDKPTEDCGILTDNDFFVHINDAVKRNEGKKIIVVGHHPIYSNGPHGGKVSQKWHLLPVIGTLYTGFKKLVGTNQDLANIRYQQLRKGLKTIFKSHPNLIYASSHDHSLQYIQTSSAHQIISGSGSRASHVKQGGRANFVHRSSGFAKISFYKEGEVWLEFWEPDGSSARGAVVYRKLLMNHTPLNKDELLAKYKHLDYSDSIYNFEGSDDFVIGGFFKKGIFGNNYRDEWGSKIAGLKYFDIGKEHGGLKIVQRGGGFQTKSLRLEDENGKQYVLRSIAKYPERAIPEAFRGTFLANIIKDQISASHPYAAFVVPHMAEAVGVYHTNPQLVYLPDDPRLGNYRGDFGKGLFLYEERPAGNRDDVDGFGNSEDIVNTLKVIKKTQKNHKSYVDQKQVVKSRLFDVVIGDWDRHDDQWRWASFEDENGLTYYQPVPRDRDQAFFTSDGLALNLGSRKWAIPKFQGFHKEIRDVEGLVFNARYFDRSFTAGLSEQEWIDAAEHIKSNLTDEVIETAIKGFPDEIYQASGEEIIAKLKSRRNDIVIYAKALYKFFSETVNITGTKKRELFEVERLANNETKVTVYANPKGEKGRKLYERILSANETKEIRLYGLKGHDTFVISGEVDQAIKLRVIGGEGNDEIDDQSVVKKGSKRTIVYDTPDGIKFKNVGEEVKNKTSEKVDVNTYDRKDFKYNVAAPVAFFGFNPDDGFFFGGGVSFTTQGFRKDPYKLKQSIKANFAPRTNSFNIDYELSANEIAKDWDFDLSAKIQAPSFTTFFYGLGNETVSDIENQGAGFYRVRFSNWIFNPRLVHKIDDNHRLTLGLVYNSVEVTDQDVDEVRFINQFVNNRGIETFNVRRNFASVHATYNLDTRDNKFNTSKGIHFQAHAEGVKDISDNLLDYVNLSSDVSFFYSFGHTFKTTLALRVGGATNLGDFEFYQANRLSSTDNLRGFRRGRFAGESTAFQQSELRIKLFEFKTSLFPTTFGIKAIHDLGRVWVDGENSDKLHRGFGGGIFLTPFNKLVINIDYTESNTDDKGVLFVRFGHNF